MSVLLTPITVILMPTAQTQTGALHVPANQVLVDRGHRVLVSEDTAHAVFINISGLTLILKFHCPLYTFRC